MIRIELTSESGVYKIETDGQETVQLTANGTMRTIGGAGARRIGICIRQLVFACAAEDSIAKLRERVGR